MTRKEKRFVIHTETMGLGGVNILMDKVTGVHYLFYFNGSAGGLTVLLDRDGKPVIQPVADEDGE